MQQGYLIKMQSETHNPFEKVYVKKYAEEEYLTEQELFVKKIIELLKFSKFSDKLLNDASKNLGWNENYYKILFSEGLGQIAIQIEKVNDLVIEKIKFNQENADNENINQVNIGTTKKIIMILEGRIINDEISKSSIIFMNNYYNSAFGFKYKMVSSYNTVDRIWKFINDKSIDFSYYSKRIILFSLYNKARSFYIKDDSENNFLTKKYINDMVVSSVSKLSSVAKILKRF